jgi:sec-independent protein translocase protein TatC
MMDSMDDKRLPFLAHLEELKNRIIWSLAALVVGVVVCFVLFREWIFDFIAAPMVRALPEAPTLHIQSPMEAFFVNLKMSVIAGIILTMPVVLSQLWLFVAPGLYRNERRMAAGFVFFGSLFFFGGVVFAYYVVFPYGFEYLLDFAFERSGNFSIMERVARVYDLEVDYKQLGLVKAAIKPTIMMEKYVSLVLKLLLAFGLIFELPLVLYFLARVGLVTHRGLWRFFRYWVVLSFLISAALTPPDIFTQTMMSGPLILMYLSGIAVAWHITRARERRERQEAAALGLEEDDPDEGDARDEDERGGT